ncbi:hypothetical protein V6N13_075664 [Hibiscus sabdariffa]|uniref:Uncharacterized protein n=1 Tax=Hibiscus sabdariffa TaxID=183260 RepID=A0ABR2UCV0_9ROSI
MVISFFQKEKTVFIPTKDSITADKAKTLAFDASMNVLATSSLLDAYSVPSVAFVTYSDSLAEALFSTFFQLVKGPSLGIKTSKADTHPGFLPPQNTYYRGVG